MTTMHSNPQKPPLGTHESLDESLFDGLQCNTRHATSHRLSSTIMGKTSMDNANGESSNSELPIYYQHVPKNILLIVLSFFTLPLSTFIVALSLLYSRFYRTPKPIALPIGSRERKTILVTGVSMTKGLAIARLLAKHTPHRIIGADTSAFSPGRFSSALDTFYQLSKPDGSDVDLYVDSLMYVIKQEEVNLWISCSSVVAAVEDGTVVHLAEQLRGKDAFKAIQFREEEVGKLHEKDQFIAYASALGLTVPESHRCTKPEQILSVLLKNSDHNRVQQESNGHEHVGRKFILKPIGVDDHARNKMMTLLPFASPVQTVSYINSLDISPSNPFQLQQYIKGEEYCTHALVIRGTVRAFVACPSSDLLMHYYALPACSPLSQAMLKFTETVAEENGESFTGHLSFDFLVPQQQMQVMAPVSEAREKEMEMERLWMKGSEKKKRRKKKKQSSSSSTAEKKKQGEKEITIYPIECNPRAHTAVTLFADTPEMATAYLSVFDAPLSRRPSFSSIRSIDNMSVLSPRAKKDIVTPHLPTHEYYWVGHDFVSLVVLPFLDMLWGIATIGDVTQCLLEFGEHFIGWKDGTFDLADPVPFWVLYQIYWPMVFVESILRGKKWSRVNVSTTKVFEG